MGTLRVQDKAFSDSAMCWKPRHVVRLSDGFEQDMARTESPKRIDSKDADACLLSHPGEAGRFGISVQDERLDSACSESELCESSDPLTDTGEVIFVCTPVTQDAESWFAFERLDAKKPRFSQREKLLLEHAVRPMKWFHRQLALHHGSIVASEPLTSSERKVLSGLLTAKTESQIADHLNLSKSTVHTYCVRICRKFGVRGRTGLTALWLEGTGVTE